MVVDEQGRQFDPDGSGGQFTTTGMPSPEDVTDGTQGQPDRQAALSTTATTGQVGPIVGWLRQSPYTEEELRLIADALTLAVVVALAYAELRGS